MKPEHSKYFLALPEADLFGDCLYFEARGEPKEGRICVGTVILERVDHRDWDGKTIQEVILKPGQFSWLNSTDRQYPTAIDIAKNWQSRYLENIVLRGCCDIAQDMIVGVIPRDPELASVNCCQYVERHFRKHMDDHPEIKGDRWWQRMKLLKVVGNHEFYF